MSSRSLPVVAVVLLSALSALAIVVTPAQASTGMPIAAIATPSPAPGLVRCGVASPAVVLALSART